MLVFISKKLHFQCPLCHLQRVLKLRNMGSSDAIYFESLHQDQLLDPPQLLPSLTTPTLPGKTKENLTPPNAATYKKHTRQNVKDMNQIPRRSLWVSFIYNTEWNSVELEVGGGGCFHSRTFPAAQTAAMGTLCCSERKFGTTGQEEQKQEILSSKQEER